MVKLILFCFDGLAWLLRWAGVDYPQFRALLEVKLTLDGRRRPSGLAQSSERGQGRGMVVALFANACMSSFIALLMPFNPTPMVPVTLLHGFVMAVLAMSLIADFSSVLLDTTDNLVLQPRPISGRTILAARLAHIVTYMSLLTLSLALVPGIAGTFKYGAVFAVVLAVTLAAALALVVGTVNFLYLTALRVTSGERLRDIILYFQVAMTIATIVGYQLLPRLMDLREMVNWPLARQWWVFLVPPAWLAAPVELATQGVEPRLAALSALGLLVPPVVLLLTLTLGAGFKEKLARLDETAAGAQIATRERRRAGARLAMRFASDRVERAAFEFLWTLTGRDRKFKLRTYPMVAMVLVMGAVMIFNGGEQIGTTFEHLHEGKKHLLLIYVCCAMLPTALIQMRFSDQFEAAWIYRALPLGTPGLVLRAGLKVIMLRLVMPTFALASLVILLIWPLSVVPDLMLGLCATVLACALVAVLIGIHLPFAEPYSMAASTGRFTRSLLLFLPCLGMGGIHYLLTLVAPGVGVWVAIPIVAAAAWVTLRAYGRVSWRAVLGQAGVPAS